MFGINKFINMQSRIASSDSLSQELVAGKKKADETFETSNENYENILNESLVHLKTFVLSGGTDKNSFEAASKGLISSYTAKPGKPEPYYYLALLFHLFGENEISLKYLKTVEFINPEFEGIELLKNDITKSYSLVENGTRNMYIDNSQANTVNQIQKTETHMQKPVSPVKRLARK